MENPRKNLVSLDEPGKRSLWSRHPNP